MTPPPSPEYARASNAQGARRSFGRSLTRFAIGLLAPALTAGALLVSLVVSADSAGAATRTMRRTNAELSYSRAVLRLMNAERRAHHLRPLRYNYKLRVSARHHNLSMASADTLSHQLPGEADFARRISAAGYRWHFVGENIGWNSEISQRGVLILERVMYQEKAPNDGHRQNILSRHYRNVGVDVFIDKAHHKIWLTTDFGRR